MHKSTLAGIIIDCQTDDLLGAARFWSDALGMKIEPRPGNYVKLVDPRAVIDIEVQSVAHPSRVHLDIEADDIDAEAGRLEELGARRIGMVQSWWVMEAPTGQRFCVVKAFSKDFETRATQWQ